MATLNEASVDRRIREQLGELNVICNNLPMICELTGRIRLKFCHRVKRSVAINRRLDWYFLNHQAGKISMAFTAWQHPPCENFTWPGFVDALATLLMVIIFVLMVFVLIQANLAYRVSGQNATLGEMRQQLASLSELLNIERRASADLGTPRTIANPA